MKQPYEKPMLYAECFALTEHIAGCGIYGKTNHTNARNCSFDIGNGLYAFYDGLTKSGCSYGIDYDDTLVDLVDPYPAIECYVGTFDGNVGGTFGS